MHDIKETVVTIIQNYLDNKIENENTKKYQLQGRSARSTRWFDLDHEWLEETFYTREPDLYKPLCKMNTKVQEMETYQIFVVLIGKTKITEEL